METGQQSISAVEDVALKRRTEKKKNSSVVYQIFQSETLLVAPKASEIPSNTNKINETVMEKDIDANSESIVIPRILMAGGGTGGHVYPAIAIADALKTLIPRVAIEFAGTQARMEWETVPKAGYAIHPITVSGMQRSLSLKNLTFPFKLLKGLFDSYRLIKGFNPDVVVGTGGYVSGPVLWVASLLKKKTVLQEQNAYAGVTNKLLAKKASRIHLAFEEAKKYFPEEKCLVSGNPTRASLLEATPEEARQHFNIPAGAQVLFLFGGSLGSAILNRALKANYKTLLEEENLYIIWQTGKTHFEELEKSVEKHPRLRLMKYVERMDLAYAIADLAVCRAGAISCSELMVTGTPAVLIPSPHVAEDHQTKNAQAMEKEGAAKVLPETEMDAEFLFVVRGMLRDTETLTRMKQACLTMAHPHAAKEIAQDILKLAKDSEA